MRPIDADALVKRLKHSPLFLGANMQFKDGVIDLVKKQPTTDVVPREEVERIKRYIRLNEDIAMKCKEENGEQNREYFKGKLAAFLQIRGFIDVELKKKYTEEQQSE